MDQVPYQVPGEITMGVRRLGGEKGGLGKGVAVVNVEWQNQLALIGKRFILPKRTQSKGIKLPWPPDNFDTTQWLLFCLRYS